MAPGYKGRARFKFFAERCPHRRNNFQDFEQQLSPILVGRFGCNIRFKYVFIVRLLEIIYDFNAQLEGTGSRSAVE